MEINLGSNIDVAWTNVISFRPGAGGVYTNINTLGLSVVPRIVNPTVVGANDPLRRNNKGVFMISLVTPSGYEALSFDLASVTNQAGWLYTQAGLVAAVDDITTWIASTY